MCLLAKAACLRWGNENKNIEVSAAAQGELTVFATLSRGRGGILSLAFEYVPILERSFWAVSRRFLLNTPSNGMVTSGMLGGKSRARKSVDECDGCG